MVGYNFEAIRQKIDLVNFIKSYYGADVKRDGSLYAVRCCFHEDQTPSLKIYSDGHFHCFGCNKTGDLIHIVAQIEGVSIGKALRTVAEKAGLSEQEYVIKDGNNGNPSRQTLSHWETARAQMPAWPTAQDGRPALRFTKWNHIEDYQYNNLDGTLRYEVQRYEHYELDDSPIPKIKPGGKSEKRFVQRWRHADGSWVWGITAGKYIKDRNGYSAFKKEHEGREAEVVEFPAVNRILYRADIIKNASEVFLVEGEKDVHTLEALGLYATTASGGANGHWEALFTEQLKDRTVNHIPDTNKAGADFGDRIEQAISGVACEYFRVALPVEYNDITDYLNSKSDDLDSRRDALAAIVENSQFSQREKQIREDGFVTPTMVLSVYPGGVPAFLDASKQPKGLKTGFITFDEMTQGLMPADLVIVAARPAMGKSAWMGNVATNVCNQGKAFAGVLAEMTKESMLQRAMCSLANVSMTKYRTAYLNSTERARLSDAFYRVMNMPLLLSDHSHLALDEHYEKLLKAKKNHDIGLVGWDYLQLLLPGSPFEKKKRNTYGNREQEVSSITRNLKLMAKELKLPFLVLAQLSRAPERRNGNELGRPQIADLRESGSIEQDADMIGFIFREEVYRPDKQNLRGLAELILAKQRNGPLGRIMMNWSGPTLTFTDRNELIEPGAPTHSDDSEGNDSQPYGARLQ